MGRTARSFAAVVVVGFAFGGVAASASASTVSFPLVSGNGSQGGTDSQVTFSDSSQADVAGPTSGPAFILSSGAIPGAWSAPINSSLWVSSAADGQSDGNPTFATTFKLPVNAGSPSLSVELLADNAAAVLVNGDQFGDDTSSPCPTDFFGAPITYTTTSDLIAGMNILTFNVNNCEPGLSRAGNYTGVDFVATVSYTPLAITEDQCEGGGWQNLVDSNGNPFGSSLACQEAATGLTAGSLPHGGVCNGIVVLSPVNGDVVVPPGGTCGLSSASTVSHDVKVSKGATLFSSATIGHDLKADDPNQIDLDSGSAVKHDLTIEGLMGGTDNEICGTTVGHDLMVRKGLASAGPLQIGCPEEGGGNTIGHDLVVENNAGTVTVDDNSAGHEARCNHGAGGSGNTPAKSNCNTA